MMILWTAVHLGVSPASKTIQDLDDWQTGLIYETAMNYPVEGMRRSYFDQKKSTQNFDENDMLDMGYSPEETIEIKERR
jgi:hypothetical protein